MQALLNSLGPWFAVPAAMGVLAAYGATLLVGLHKTRSQQRIEFLGLWKSVENEDDMRLEVLIRHHFGTYLPATVIRRLCAQDYCAANILEVSQLWGLYRYDSERKTIHWLKEGYESRSVLRSKGVMLNILYFVCAFLSFGFVGIAINSGPKNFVSWICGLNAVLFLIVAWAALARAEVFSLAAKRGNEWIANLNKRKSSK